jgi:transporter family protein
MKLFESFWFWLVLAIVGWGLWAFLIKAAGEKVPWQAVFVLSAIWAVPIALCMKPWSIPFAANAAWGLVLAGTFCGCIASVFFYKALSMGQASVIVPLSGLYIPLCALLAAVFLREGLDWKKGLGVACATLAVVLLGDS